MKTELFCDNFQNYKRYGIPKAQLVVADIPYNIGKDAYGSSREWYTGGDNRLGESKKAGKPFFHSDVNFNIAEYFHFCHKLLKDEPREKGKAPAMVVFCAFQQQQMVIEYGKKHGFGKYIPLTFIKNYSPQVLKANMRIVGATEYAILLYRDKLPKFNNNGHMVFNWFNWPAENRREYPKVHPNQKPVPLLKKLIEIFTDKDDVVVDPCAGSGATLRAAMETGRSSYGFECNKKIFQAAKDLMLSDVAVQADIFDYLGQGESGWARNT